MDVALVQGLGIQRHRFFAGDLHKDIALVGLGHDLLGIDFQKGVLRTNTIGRFHVQQPQVHVHRHPTGGWHGQALRVQVQCIQVQVQIGKPRGFTEHHLQPSDGQTTQLRGCLRRLQIQCGNARPTHCIVLPGEQARQETHRRIATGDVQRTSFPLGIGVKLNAFVEDHLLGPIDDQLPPVAQYNGVGDHHLARGLDGDVAIHVHLLAEGDVHRIADHQAFDIGQFAHLQTQGPSVTFGLGSSHQVTQLGTCCRQGVAHLKASTHRNQAHIHHHAILDPDVGRGTTAATPCEDHALVGEAAVGIGHSLAGVCAEIAPRLGDADALGGGPDASTDTAIDVDAALVRRQIQHIGAAGAAIDAPCNLQICRLVGGRITHAEHHTAIKANRIIDQGALRHGQHRAIGKHRGVAGSKNAQFFALDRAGHFNLATHS